MAGAKRPDSQQSPPSSHPAILWLLCDSKRVNALGLEGDLLTLPLPLPHKPLKKGLAGQLQASKRTGAII